MRNSSRHGENDRRDCFIRSMVAECVAGSEPRQLDPIVSPSLLRRQAAWKQGSAHWPTWHDVLESLASASEIPSQSPAEPVQPPAVKGFFQQLDDVKIVLLSSCLGCSLRRTDPQLVRLETDTRWNRDGAKRWLPALRCADLFSATVLKSLPSDDSNTLTAPSNDGLLLVAVSRKV